MFASRLIMNDGTDTQSNNINFRDTLSLQFRSCAGPDGCSNGSQYNGIYHFSKSRWAKNTTTPARRKGICHYLTSGPTFVRSCVASTLEPSSSLEARSMIQPRTSLLV